MTLFRAVGVIILRISHGYRPKTENDELVRIADEATDQLNILLSPGLFAVDFLPFLRHIPEWLPGGGFHKVAREWRQTLFDMTDKSYQFVLDQMVRAPGAYIFAFAFGILRLSAASVVGQGNCRPQLCHKFARGPHGVA